jgi:hypothetical protein
MVVVANARHLASLLVKQAVVSQISSAKTNKKRKSAASLAAFLMKYII